MSLLQFRFLLCSELALVVFFTVVGVIGDPFLPAELQEIEEGMLLSGTIQNLLAGAAIGEMILYTVAFVLLWRTHPLGRVLYGVGFLVSLPISALLGHVISSGPLYAIESVAALISAAILITPFLPPLNRHFNHPCRQR